MHKIKENLDVQYRDARLRHTGRTSRVLLLPGEPRRLLPILLPVDQPGPARSVFQDDGSRTDAATSRAGEFATSTLRNALMLSEAMLRCSRDGPRRLITP